MKRIILLVTVALLMVAYTSVAQAQPAEQSPVGGTPVHTAVPGPPTFSHTHHVDTGNGCVDINSVVFEADNRGLHQGASKSGALGPAHGACSPSP